MHGTIKRDRETDSEYDHFFDCKLEIRLNSSNRTKQQATLNPETFAAINRLFA